MDEQNLQPIGPGAAPEATTDPKPLLDERGVTEMDFVEILNPLSVTFVGQAALTTNVNASIRIGPAAQDGGGLSHTENDIRSLYGFDMRASAAQSGKTHLINRIPIESGKTVRLLGNEAHVVLRQLVNTVMQREGNGQLLANGVERRKVEERLVQRVGSLQDMMGRAPLSVQEQLKSTLQQLDDANLTGQVTEESASGEQAFPDITRPGAGADSSQSNESDRATGQSGPRTRSGKA
jgi:hypothetical protein